MNKTINKNENEINTLSTYNHNIVCGWDIGIKNCSYCIIETVDSSNIKEDSSNIKEDSSNIEEDSSNIEDNVNKNIILINGNRYNVKYWDVINILPEVEKKQILTGNISLDARPKLKCTHILKQLVISSNDNEIDKNELIYCNKNAVFVNKELPNLNNDNNLLSLDDKLNPYGYKSYCNKHFKELNYNLITNKNNTENTNENVNENTNENVNENTNENVNENNYINLNNKELKCCYLLDGNKCTSSRISWINPNHYFLSYCEKHKKIIDKQLLEDNISLKCIKIIKNNNAIKLDLTMIGDALYKRFDTLKELCNVNTVLLENQPVLTNPTMKSIQMFLFSYFIINGIQSESSPCEKIKCYSANQKLDLHKILIDKPEIYDNFKNIISKLANVYSRNKKLAILLVEYILTHCSINNGCNDLLTFFKEHKKKDDLADSFLMTLHFLETDNLKKMIPISDIKDLLKKSKGKSKGKDKSKDITTITDSNNNINDTT